MKAKLEWCETGIGGSVVWRQANVEVSYSRNNNYFFRHNGAVYVFPLLKFGTEVVANYGDGKWRKAGRITHNGVFLGSGESYSEHNERVFRGENQLPKVVMP